MGDVGAGKKLETISPIEFASTFASSVRDHEQRHTWFFGAGCSITSGIPTAGGLVEKWLRELQQNQKLPKDKFDAWVRTEFSGFDPATPAKHYAKVFRRRYRTLDAQQREIEQICARSEPSYGYATFAQILSLKEFGKRCNTILTTNFDDLIADALYMYGDREMRPQIITHEALARYVRTGSPRPTIIKLHGDAHFTPKNMQNQTDKLEDGIAREVEQVVRDSALIFVGYGGNDESIAKFFKSCPTAELAPQIYWIGKHDPGPELLEWLAGRDALRVDHTDFDKLMHHLRGALDIPHPEKTRWEQNFKRYLEQYKSFEDELKTEPESPEKLALQQTSQVASKSLPTDWDYYFRASKARTPSRAEKIYREGIEANPNSSVLLGMFALFLERQGDMDGADAFYKRAITANATDADNLVNYAVFLETVRKDFDGAETLYKRTIEIEPRGAVTLGNYANFLQTARKDMEGAEAFYKRAIDAEPARADAIGNYAQMLFTLGREAEGLAKLRQAQLLAVRDDTKAELMFYTLAHDADGPRDTLSRLKVHLSRGARSPRWDFSTDLAAAERNGRADLPLLRDLAAVISEEQPINVLDKHEAWQRA